MATRSAGRSRKSEDSLETIKGATTRRMARSNNGPVLSDGNSQRLRPAGLQASAIVIEDDDDDVQASSPRSFAQARSFSRRRAPPAVEVAIPEVSLGLRLGPPISGVSVGLRLAPPGDSTGPALRAQRTRAGGALVATPPIRRPLTIDLTSPGQSNDDCVIVKEKKAPQPAKRKTLPAEPVEGGERAVQASKEVKLTCPVCLDEMKDETSTICGHIFCWGCIQGAIAAQRKCPTCRKRLTPRSAHRIYLTAKLGSWDFSTNFV
ncbi:hypothetical protein R1sor_024707 [Riccia sorocarpa]|uniref:RING-type domain-containing protein n=1 Tax=Riccia sorocarpa TaxID=122646 RepID=A0ABD3GT53_9MARC